MNEYHVKGIFLYNFAKFVEWPAHAFKTHADPMTICTAGTNPFGTALETVIQDEKIRKRALLVRTVTETRQAAGCHILYFSISERKRSRSWLPELRRLSILTVGETEEFLQQGGIVAFRLKDSRVRFTIDGEAALRAGLKISSKLLRLADKPKGAAK